MQTAARKLIARRSYLVAMRRKSFWRRTYARWRCGFDRGRAKSNSSSVGSPWAGCSASHPFPRSVGGWHRCRNPCRRAGSRNVASVRAEPSSGAIGYLTPGQQERDGTTLRVGQSMDLRGPPAARSADGLLMFPPLPPDAHRCAFTAELSIRTCAGGPPAVASAWNMSTHNALRCPADDCRVFCADHRPPAHRSSAHRTSEPG